MVNHETLNQNLLHIPEYNHSPTPYSGISRQQVIDLKSKYVNPVVGTYYQRPIMIVEGSMQYVFDETGKRYLDAFAGIATVNVGHCHPHVVHAIQTQSAKLQHATTLYLHPTLAEYSKMLVDKMPKHLSAVYFVNSGSEANDLAMLMARVYTNNFEMITLRNGYHGVGGSSMGLTSQNIWKYHTPHSFGVHHALNPDSYRGLLKGSQQDLAQRYADEVDNLIQHATSGQVAGMIVEPVQGVGGTVTYPNGYLKKAQEYVHKAGGVFIVDEVQTGFCRTGTFWGFESHDVQPDIVTMAKAIGNGMPLAAVVTTAEIAQAFTQKSHFNTFGGNPVACAAGKAVLEVIEQDNLQQNSREVGHYLLNRLKHLSEKYEVIGDVRGVGLMLGVELVKNRQAKTPNPELTSKVHELSKELGLLVGKGGFHRNVLRIKPPLCIHKEDADFIFQVLDFSLNYLT